MILSINKVETRVNFKLLHTLILHQQRYTILRTTLKWLINGMKYLKLLCLTLKTPENGLCLKIMENKSVFVITFILKCEVILIFGLSQQTEQPR